MDQTPNDSGREREKEKERNGNEIGNKNYCTCDNTNQHDQDNTTSTNTLDGVALHLMNEVKPEFAPLSNQTFLHLTYSILHHLLLSASQLNPCLAPPRL